jgi:hypothetical protein
MSVMADEPGLVNMYGGARFLGGCIESCSTCEAVVAVRHNRNNYIWTTLAISEYFSD